MIFKNSLIFVFCFVTDALYLYKNQDELGKHKAWPRHHQCGRSALWRAEKAIGGHTANLAEYPWMTRLGYRSSKTYAEQFSCGGSLISNKYVLTAAHCCEPLEDYELTFVELGEFDIHRTKDCFRGRCAPPPLTVDIEEIIKHHTYDPETLKNDICLLRLREEVEFNDYIQPICLPTSEDMKNRSFVGTTMTVAGWGAIEMTPIARFPDVLQEVRVRVLSGKSCWGSFDDSAQICAGNPQVNDACGGDSGGPMMYTTREDGAARQYVVGVVSSGDICTHENVPSSAGVYTRVSKYISWILETIH